MTLTPKSARITSAGRAAAAIVLGVAVLAGSLSGPARADGNDRRDGHDVARDRDDHRRPEARFDGYDTAPPVVYAPPAYYQQPTASLNFSFPLFR